ncbi:MAG: hypothetical protein Q8O72_03890, partial [Bacteroidales bacterium]|nr:hypothetical protein [Bacteroidales bacterium]
MKTPISATTFSSKGYCSAIDPSGNVYMAGFKDTQVSYTETFGNLLLQKYNSSGDLLLDTTFTGTGVVHQLMTDSSGNVLVAIEHLNALEVDGVTIPNPTVFPQHAFLKLSSAGDLLWHKVMNVTDSHVQNFMSIVVDASNNIYLGYDDYGSCFIEKLDPNGNTMTMITQTNVNRITSLAVDTEGNIYAAGSCANTNSIFAGVLQPTDFDYTVYLVKYSPTGVFQWLNYVEDITCAAPIVKVHTPNDIYFCAETFVSVQLGAITLNGSFSGVNFFLTKLNASGEYLWAREAPATGNVEVGTRNYLSLDALGNVYFAGIISGGLTDWGNDITTDTHTFSNREALLLQ